MSAWPVLLALLLANAYKVLQTHGFPVVAVEPVFPEGSASIVHALKAMNQRVNTDIDDQDQMEQVAEAGKARLDEAIQEEDDVEAFASAALGKARQRILQHKYLGGCPRNFSGCPLSWMYSDSTALCSPSEDYDGSCTSFNISMFALQKPQEKEAFAVKCRLSWPCLRICERNLMGCPEDWEALDGSCWAPDDYAGDCSPVTDFEGLTSLQRIRWAEMCSARWPCEDAEQTAQLRKLPRRANGPIPSTGWFHWPWE